MIGVMQEGWCGIARRMLLGQSSWSSWEGTVSRTAQRKGERLTSERSSFRPVVSHTARWLGVMAAG